MMNRRLLAVLMLVAVAAMVGQPAWSQTTVSQGSIQGTITDPSGGVVADADITISNQETGAVLNLRATSDGTYSSGGLFPGKYTVRVAAPGFKTTEISITVQVTVTASGNIKLDVGSANTVVEVQANAVTVNTEQSTVQGVLTAEQIDRMPIDGRNFLDLAQLEPGVQIQDGQDFDPTKAGYSSVSVNGVFGRTPRIELDGLDISDETVGTTTQNIGLGSIEEFNIQRSSLDLSTELTSAGAVNVTTKSGTNTFHGQGFYNFRDRNAGLAGFPGSYITPTDYQATGTYFQRNNYGGRIGGPIWKDKLFFFIDAERMMQNGLEAVSVAAPFSALSGGFNSPFRDTDLTGKVDWQATKNIHVFYKFTYNWNKSAATFYSGYPVYDTKDNAPSDAVGFDYTKGNWSHSVRFGYLKFHNQLVDGTQGASFYNPLPEDGVLFDDLGFFFGPNLLAPQGTYQSNKQIKYDGSKLWGKHILRFGISSNRIEGGGFASFFGTAPLLITLGSAGPVSGSASDPLNYPLLTAQLGNGQGFFTEKPGFNLPSGGQSDWRLSWYVGDSWKIKPNLTFTYGLRYNRDTGRTDSDLAPIPCSQISPLIVATGEAPCAGSSLILSQFGNTSGLGNRVRQPDTNFGPQAGFAWDPTGSGKTVIRVGAGLYYENSIFNNTLFDRPAKLPTGLFNAVGVLGCGPTTPGSVFFAFTPTESVTSVDGQDLATQVCGEPLSVAGPLVADLQTEFQAAVAGHAISNPNYIGNSLALTSQFSGLAAFDPNWRTPRSWQMNAGFQREIFKGVLTADYIRNVSLAFPLTVDVNHVGDARYLNVAAAKNAISLTTAAAGCGGGFSAAAINCAIGAGDTISSFAANGLDSGYAYYGGLGLGAFDVANGVDLTPDTGAAFAGINPLMGPGDIEEPIGRSVYNALQMTYKQTVRNPVRYITSMDVLVSYTLSRFVSTGGDDQNFSALAWDNNDPTHVMGPTGLNRTNSFKFGDTMQITPRGPQISVIGNFGSPNPTLLSLATQSGAAYPQTAEIFLTDVTGDGSVQDLFNPNGGQGRPGQYGGGGGISNLANAIARWNNNVAGTLTPAGQALVNAGLFTTAQLQGLQAVKPWIAPPPQNPVGAAPFKEVSATFAWPIRIKESVTIVPSISAFNVFNMANYGIPGYSNGIMTDQTSGPYPAGVNGVAGSPNGTSPGVNRASLRVGTGSGVFANGAPRQLEWGLKLNF
jgi:Carboxypeptidase regulatory-like domain